MDIEEGREWKNKTLKRARPTGKKSKREIGRERERERVPEELTSMSTADALAVFLDGKIRLKLRCDFCFVLFKFFLLLLILSLIFVIYCFNSSRRIEKIKNYNF